MNTQANTAGLTISDAMRRTIRNERLAQLKKNKAFIVGTALLAFWVLCALVGKYLVPISPDEMDLDGTTLSPNSKYWFGSRALRNTCLMTAILRG